MLKINKTFIKIKYVYMNKVNVTYNQLIDYKAYIITIFHLH